MSRNNKDLWVENGNLKKNEDFKLTKMTFMKI